MTTTITKAIANITDAGTDDSGPGTFEAILSAPTVDRDGDVFKADEWKTPLPARIPIDIDHELSVSGTIGSGEPYLHEDGTLRLRGVFASTPKAQEVRTLVREGHIGAMSVACMTDKVLKKAGEPSRELLNAAIVPIPSNREALILTSKAPKVLAQMKAAEADDGAMVQAVHDAAVVLGAACVEPGDDAQSGVADGSNKASVAPTRKTVRASVINTKALKGSVEDLQDRIRSALRSAYAEIDGYPYMVATFLGDDGASGTVVYELWDSETGDVTLGREFTDDGSVVTLADELAQVATITTVEQIGPTVTVTQDPDQDGDAGVSAAKPILRSVTMTGTSPTEGVTPALTPEQFTAKLGELLTTMTSGQQVGTPHNEVTAAPGAADDAATIAAADAAVTEAAEEAARDAAGSESDVATENAANALLLGVDALIVSETSDSPTQ